MIARPNSEIASRAIITNPLCHSQWDDWMSEWGDATPFHSAGWIRTLVDAYGFEPCYAVIPRSDGLRAVLPMMEVRGVGGRRRGVGLPYTDLCGALTREPGDLNQLIEALSAEAVARGWRTMEFRGPVAPDEFCTLPSAVYYTHDVDICDTEEAQWNQCATSVRRAARKAWRSDLVVDCGCDDERMNDFYTLFTLTRRRHGLPPPPLEYFRLLQRYLQETGAGTVILAQRDGQKMAAAIFMRFGNNGLFKYGASDMRYQSDRPNDLVMWEGLRWCRAQGCRTVALGKTCRSQDGLRRFKLGWGARENITQYHLYDVSRKQYVVGHDNVDGWYNTLFRRMPLPLLRLSGKFLYRYAA